MSDLVVIVPSRGRPTAARELIEQFTKTCTADTQLVFAVDDNDPTMDQYVEAVLGLTNVAVGIVEQPSTMVHALNRAAMAIVSLFTPPPFAMGFMGDDHRPRTEGWDTTYLDALRELGTGIVYGDDMFQGEHLPTQCAMTLDIVGVLGYMAPPNLQHMYVDNFWRDLGNAAHCLRYLPDVIVEHVHPIADKGEWNEGYARVNAPEVYAADQQAYEYYVAERFAHDVATIEALR